jgi:hypothetical protein
MGVIRRHPDGRFDPNEAGMAFRIYSRPTPAAISALCDAIDTDARTVEVGLDRLARMQQERRLDAAMRGVGPRIGKMIARLDLLAALAPTDRREFEQSHVRLIQTSLIGALLSALGVGLATDEVTDPRTALRQRCGA